MKNCEEAKNTIDIYKLNRQGLCASRVTVLNFVKKLKTKKLKIDIS